MDRIDMVIVDRLSSTYFNENKRLFHSAGNKLVRFLINSCFYRVFGNRDCDKISNLDSFRYNLYHFYIDMDMRHNFTGDS